MRNEIIFDEKGNPDIMVAFTPNELGLPSILKGRRVEAYLIGKYIATMVDGTPYSLPYQRPETNRSFDDAVRLCESKGEGWHLITNDEWAGIALQSQKHGTLPHGNTNHGADLYCPEEKGVTYNNSKTMTGSGPITWNHDHTPEGVADMCGNVWEFVGGLRFLTGEVQIIPNNKAAAGADQSRDSKEWTPIYTVDGDTVNYSVRNEEIKIKPIPTGKRYFTGAPFAGLNDTEIDVPHELVELGLYPAGEYKGKDRFWLYNDEDDEVCVSRGGSWGNGMNAGIFSLNASNTRTARYSNIGFRLAYVRYSEEAAT